MFTTETGIGVVAMIVFAAFWLAFMLWEDWGQAGKTARARASAKANGWEQDEMQNTITRNGAIIAYRLMTVGLFVVMLVDIIAFGKNVSEFAILWFVCMVFEGVYRTIATYRAAKDDEENPPSKSALAGDIVKRIFIPVARRAACGRRTWQSCSGYRGRPSWRWRTISTTRPSNWRLKPHGFWNSRLRVYSSLMKNREN